MRRASAVAGVLAFVGFVAAGLLGAIAYMQYDKFRKERMRLKDNERKMREDLETRNHQLEAELADLRRRLMQATVNANKLQDEKDALEKQLQTQKQILEEIKRREEELREGEAELRAAKARLEILQSTLTEKSRQLDALSQKVEQQDKELARLRKAEIEYKRLLKRADEQSQLLAQKKAEVARLRRRINWLQEELSKAQSGQSGRITALQRELEQVQRAREELGKKCEKLEAERDSLMEQLKEVVGKLEAKRRSEEKFARKFMEELQVLTAVRSSMGTLWLRCSDGVLPGTLLSLSQVLDLDINTASFHAEVRGMGRFGFSFDFFQTSFTTSTTLTEDVAFSGITLDTGHDVKGRFGAKWGTAAVSLSLGSLFRTGFRRIDLAVMVGVRLAEYTAWLKDVTDGEEADASLQMVSPFFGFLLTYHLATDISFTVRAAGGSVSYQDYSCPHFVEASALVSMKITSYLWLEAGYIFTVQKFHHDDPNTGEYSRFEHTSSSPYLGLLFVF